jgi:hypothetical protein
LVMTTAAAIMSEVENVQEKESGAEAICMERSARNGSCLGE